MVPLLTLPDTNVKDTNIDFRVTLEICFPDCSRLKQSKQALRVFPLKILNMESLVWLANENTKGQWRQRGTVGAGRACLPPHAKPIILLTSGSFSRSYKSRSLLALCRIICKPRPEKSISRNLSRVSTALCKQEVVTFYVSSCVYIAFMYDYFTIRERVLSPINKSLWKEVSLLLSEVPKLCLFQFCGIC